MGMENAPGGRFSVKHEGFLAISNVQPSDSGLYRVNISNDQGSALHRVRLQVTPAPIVTVTEPDYDGKTIILILATCRAARFSTNSGLQPTWNT